MPSKFGFEGDTASDTDFKFGHGYFGNGQVDSIQLENDLSKTSELEYKSYNFSYYLPVYIPMAPSETWSTTSSYSELLLPPVPVSPPPDDSPNPPYNLSVKVQPLTGKVIGEKRPRLAEFGEENILPEDEVRKRVKTSRYVEQ